MARLSRRLYPYSYLRLFLMLAFFSHPVTPVLDSALLPPATRLHYQSTTALHCIVLRLSDLHVSNAVCNLPSLPKPRVTRSLLHTKPSERVTHIPRRHPDPPRLSCLVDCSAWFLGWVVVGDLFWIPQFSP